MSAKKVNKVNKALLFGGKKAAATPRRASVGDANTKQMSMSTWTPRNMRRRAA